MTYNMPEEMTLISAICDKMDDLPLTRDQIEAYNKWEADNNLGDIVINGNEIQQIEDAKDIAELTWPEFEDKLDHMELKAEIISIQHTGRTRLYRRLLVGVAASLLLAAGLLIFRDYKIEIFGGRKNDAKPVPSGIQLSSQKATLVLSDNSTIDLAAVEDGTLVTHGPIKIIKPENGLLTYVVNRKLQEIQEQKNTLMTPRGGNYRVILSDGTLIYLNAESAIRYPTMFSGTERIVELVSGEAYFEVAKSTGQRFIVKQGSNKIVVTGTRFNINSYTDEQNVKTTLLEGAVTFKTTGDSLLLKPGHQAIISDNKTRIQVKLLPNFENVVSWKDGYFIFEEVELEDIMKEVERWYDVYVIFKDKFESDPMVVPQIPKSTGLEEFIEILRVGDRFHFTINDSISDKRTVFIYK